jgi:hypothetical protein
MREEAASRRFLMCHCRAPLQDSATCSVLPLPRNDTTAFDLPSSRDQASLVPIRYEVDTGNGPFVPPLFLLYGGRANSPSSSGKAGTCKGL